MRYILFTLILFYPIATSGQQEGRMRTRLVDYAEYDRLVANFSYAQDKEKAADQLLDFVGKNFTAGDEEYFYARYLVCTQVNHSGSYLKTTELLQQAIEAYEKYYPFYHRGYTYVSLAIVGQTYLNLSLIYQRQHLHTKNIRFLKNYRTLLEGNPDPYTRRTYYLYLGESLFQNEQYDSAIQTFLKVKELSESGAFNYQYPAADDVYKITSDIPEETKQQLLKAKAKYVASMKKMEESLAVNNRLQYSSYLARAYFYQYKYDACLPYARQQADDMAWIYKDMYEVLSKAHEQTKDLNIHDSLKTTQQAAANQRRIQEIGGTSALVVISALKTNRHQIAEQYSFGLIEQSLLKQIDNDIKSAEKSYETLFQAIEKLKEIKGYGQAVKSYYEWINPYYLNLKVKSNQLTEALARAQSVVTKEEERLIKNFQYFTENEKKEFFKNYTKELERYYSLLLLNTEKGTDKTGDLLNKILQTKGLILDATREQEKQLRKIKDKETLAQLAQVRTLRDKLAAFNQQFATSQQPALSDSINRIAIRVGELEQSINLKLIPINLIKPVRWQQVQAKLKAGEAYLEIFRVQRDNFNFDKPKIQYWAIVVKPGDTTPTLFLISEGEAFESRNLHYYQNSVRGRLEDSDSYNLYWKKISEHLQEASTVIVSADGVYHIVNPVALKNPGTGKFVVDEIEIKRISTGRDLLTIAETNLTNKTVVLVGNPRFEMSRKQSGNTYRNNEVTPVEANENTRAGIELLPGTKKEVERISTKAEEEGFQIEMLTGPDASESNVKKLSSPSVLHLATHGQFDQFSKADTYLKSKLILAGAADTEPFSVSDYALYEDGFLTAYEVTQLDLPNTQLVVLSACETGLGEIQSGEGVWGLQRAFQLAGAQSVMGSLWKISDEATVIFMDAFYEHYLRTKNISQAYRHAMQTTRQEYPQPYYWGAFTLIGGN